MKIISLGWGVQSFGLAAMSALGILPRVDAAIHADTTHECTATYEFAKRWTPWLEERGIKVITVKPRGAASPEIDEWGGVFIPAYTIYGPLNSRGQLRRQCTGDWKIKPIRRWLQANRKKEQVEIWLGITLDEAMRAKPADVKYIVNRWPFLEPDLWGGNRLRRSDVATWLLENNLEIPPRSACYFCPYHSDNEWRAIKENGDWQRAIEFDKNIRNLRPPYPLFIHAARIPLSDIDLSTPEARGQLSLWQDECEGMCGL